MTLLNNIPTHDLNFFLHELRMLRLAQMPAEAPVVLSGGAANEIYFEWFAEHYPGRVERHIAVELFSPPPDPLPEGVEWLARTLGDLSPVGDREVDLVFAGQVIEHLWPDDVAGFLCEAHRVLRPGGTLVVDSPTRFITEGLGWTQPEHTIELEVDEIVELLELAGFVDVDVKGIWLCYDRDRARMLPLDVFGGGEDWPWQRRVIEAENRPRDSFIWWAEARNDDVRGDSAAVKRRVHEIYVRARPTYFARMRTDVGQPADNAFGRHFRAPRGQRGLLLIGPSIAMPTGRHEALFRLRAEATESPPEPNAHVAEVEVTRDDGRVVAHWALTARDLPPGGATREVVLPFELPDTAFNGELRVRALGIVPVIANVPVAVHEDVAGLRMPHARPLGRDSPRVQAEVALRRVRRVVGWPARRLLDPRLEGLRNHGQWLAATISERIDERASELGARIDGLAERVQSPSIESTASERSAVLPYVLGAVGRLTPGATILVGDAVNGAISVVLGDLGYEIATTPSPDTSAEAAVIRADRIDHARIEGVIRTVRPGGVVVLIGEGLDQTTIDHLLDGWLIEDKTVTEPQREGGASLTLTRASLPVSVDSGPSW
jgi:SAM-dependent methyltransferase